MNLNKCLSPDATTPAASSTTATAVVTTSVNKKTYIPTKESDILRVATDVSATWKKNVNITLAWKTQTAFDVDIASYTTSYNSRKSSGGNRTADTKTLNIVTRTIDEAVVEVKNYIKKKFKTVNAPAQFPRYGIIKENGNWRFPKHEGDKVTSLGLMVAAIAADGFGTEEYGTPFWTAIQTSYVAALAATTTDDKAVSTAVGSKNVSKDVIISVLESIILLLKANYPTTYSSTVLAWGFKK